MAVLGAAAVGVAVLLSEGAANAVDPTQYGWAVRGDWSQHVLGWLHFRNSQWTLPLGTVGSYLHPAGTTVGFTDSLPWAAVFFKLLSPLLPTNFQYIGLWLLLCFALQGAVGAHLVRLLGGSPLQSFEGGALFTLAPVLSQRMGHDTLCGHWLILAVMALHLRPVTPGSAGHREHALAAAVVVVAAGVHPYLAAMSGTLALALVIRNGFIDRRMSRTVAAAWCVGLVVLLAGVFVLFGYLGGGATTSSPGFGAYSADMLTLFNPMGTSRVLPTLPTGPSQYEGYGFLGLGVIALGTFGVAAYLRRPKSERRPSLRRVMPLIIACGLMSLFALSSAWTFAGMHVVSARALLKPLGFLFEPFRASGRFIWPVHYLFVVGAIALALRSSRRSSMVSVILAAAVAVQAWDLSAQYLLHDHFPTGEEARLTSPGWKLAKEGPYRHLALYPPRLEDGASHVCVGGARFSDEFLPFAFEAARLGLTFNGGYVARMNRAKVQRGCDALLTDITAGALKPDVIYAVHPDYAAEVRRAAPHATCAPMDGATVCVAEATTTLGQFLRGAASGK